MTSPAAKALRRLGGSTTPCGWCCRDIPVPEGPWDWPTMKTPPFPPLEAVWRVETVMLHECGDNMCDRNGAENDRTYTACCSESCAQEVLTKDIFEELRPYARILAPS